MISGRNLLWILPLLLLATYPVWQPVTADLLKPRTVSGGRPEQIAGGEPGSSKIDMGEVELSQQVNGAKEWRLHAVHLVSSAADTLFDLEEVRVLFYGDQGETTEPVTITGDRGRYDTQAQILTLADNVEVKTADGKVMRTQHLRYLTGLRILKASAGVHMAGANFDVRGNNLTYNLAAKSYTVAGGVFCKVW